MEELSQKTIKEINKARERIKAGEFFTQKEVEKILNLKSNKKS